MSGTLSQQSSINLPSTSAQHSSSSSQSIQFDVQERRAPALHNVGMSENGRMVVNGIEDLGTLSPTIEYDRDAHPYETETPRTSHLPTPQSPNNAVPYYSNGNTSPQSPLFYTHGRNQAQSSFMSSRFPQRMQTPDVMPQTSFLQTITPSSSPARPLRHTPTPSGSRSESQLLGFSDARNPVYSVNSEALAPAHIISPPVGPHGTTQSPQASRSSLSSPFVTTMRFLDESGRNAAQSSSLNGKLQTFPPASGGTRVLDSLSHDHHFGVHPLQLDEANVPPMGSIQDPGGSVRPVGNEIDRIRVEQSTLEQVRGLDLEMRRPEYLKRFKRFSDSVVNDGGNITLASAENERMGITSTPMKGRRIQLFDFQETSAESFEESLMTHGYGTFGVERTPQRRISPSDGRSREAVEWLTNNSAAVGRANEVHTPAPEPQPEPILTEKEFKKRKRLEAFKSFPRRIPSKLKPVEVEGKGRVLVDLPADELEDLQSSPNKKRATGRKKRGGAVDKKGKAPARRTGSLPTVGSDRSNTLDEPHWLDNEFPWCLRVKERDEALSAEQSERLKWIERYLDRDTDSEDGDDGDGAPPRCDEEVMPSSAWGQIYEDPPVPPRRGRGKMVPLQADPEPGAPVRRRSATVPERNQNVFFPSDPADARAALLSKRTVRLLERRRKRRFRGGDTRDEGMACVCGQGDEDDGRAAVQCDECFTWHHLECIGVQDESELGAEDDPWYCAECSRKGAWPARAATPEPPTPEQVGTNRQPTFVPTDDRPLPMRISDIALYSSSPPQPSPFRDWNANAALRTPLQQKRRTTQDAFPSRSIWDDGVPAGPSTPPSSSRHVRVYSTPGSRFDVFGADEAAFPHTPSRSRMSFSTPKNNSSSWTARTGSSGGLGFGPNSNGPFATPRAMLNRHGAMSLADESAGTTHNRSMSSSYGYAPTYDDTPIRRTVPQGVDRARGVRGLVSFGHGQSQSVTSVGQLLDSPLAMRGQPTASLTGMDLEESPIVRSANIAPRAMPVRDIGEADEDVTGGER